MKFAEWIVEAQANFSEFNSDNHERLEGKRECLFDTELRKNFMKVREKAEEAEMTAWTGKSLLGCQACSNVG